jgi:hypothetical protein
LFNGGKSTIDMQDAMIKISAEKISFNDALIIDKTDSKILGKSLFVKRATFAGGTSGDRV